MLPILPAAVTRELLSGAADGMVLQRRVAERLAVFAGPTEAVFTKQMVSEGRARRSHQETHRLCNCR